MRHQFKNEADNQQSTWTSLDDRATAEEIAAATAAVKARKEEQERLEAERRLQDRILDEVAASAEVDRAEIEAEIRARREAKLSQGTVQSTDQKQANKRIAMILLACGVIMLVFLLFVGFLVPSNTPPQAASPVYETLPRSAN